MHTPRWIARSLCFLAALVLAFCPYLQALAEEYVFVAPSLPSDVTEYDPEHPELLDEDQLYAKSAILIEASSGDVIFEKDADSIMFPASTTTIMTILRARVTAV